MQSSSRGYVPEPGLLAEQMDGIAELRHHQMPEYKVHEYSQLLDSSNLGPADWLAIARDIHNEYEEYDGFVVLHGTDTMAYTASALSFMLGELSKPVVVTGSQIPLSEIRNDARENLIASLLIAGSFPIPEVCLYFGNKLLRGNRSVKVNADGLDAFDSPNFPPLGVAGVDFAINWEAVLKPRLRHPLQIQEMERMPNVGSFRLFPGVTAQTLRNLLQPPMDGVILEAFGVGNAPDRDQEILAALEDATERGVVLVACTQCLKGSVDLGDYFSGSRLASSGVIGGYDMTSEAALTKLFWLLSSKRSPEEVRILMQTSLRGELSRS